VPDDNRCDWIRDVMLPVIGVSVLLGMAAGGAIGWPGDWESAVDRNAFWGWTVCMGLALGFTSYIATGSIGLIRWFRES
jgi:hypothetical protein